MRFCDFFSGIGGFRLGLEWAGHKGVWACEVDEFCRKIYAQHFEESQGKDINDVKAEEIPEAELWCGGFPCQDLSVAGKRAGLKARRSGLYWTWHRLIEAQRPPWLLIENVPGLLSSHDGGDFRLLLSSLIGGEVPMPRHGRWPDAGLIRALGVEVAWRILDAQYFGLAQRRRRVFIVRYLGDGGAAEVLFECAGGEGYPRSSREAGSEIAAGVEGCANNYGGLKSPIAGFMAGQGAKARSIAYQEEQSPTLKAAESGSNRAPCVVGALKRRHDGSAGRGGGNPIISSDSLNQERGGEQFDAENEMVRASGRDVQATAPPNPNGVREATGLPGRMDTPDSPRYKALGNAVAVPVIEWIGRRLPK